MADASVMTEREVRKLQDALLESIRDLRKSHASWNGYRESFAVKLQEWDSLSESVELETSDGLFPIRSEAEVQTAHESREEVMSKGRKVDGVLIQILQDTSRYAAISENCLVWIESVNSSFRSPSEPSPCHSTSSERNGNNGHVFHRAEAFQLRV